MFLLHQGPPEAPQGSPTRPVGEALLWPRKQPPFEPQPSESRSEALHVMRMRSDRLEDGAVKLKPQQSPSCVEELSASSTRPGTGAETEPPSTARRRGSGNHGDRARAPPLEAPPPYAPHWPPAPALPEATNHRPRLLTKSGETPQARSRALCTKPRLMA